MWRVCSFHANDIVSPSSAYLVSASLNKRNVRFGCVSTGSKTCTHNLENGFSFLKKDIKCLNVQRQTLIYNIYCFKGERTIKGVRIHMPQTHSHFILFLSKCMICKPKCALHMNMVHLLIILLKSHTLEPYSH